jgi:hypothetical protein
MTQTTTFDIIKIEDEFLNFLRCNLNSYDSKKRIEERTTSITLSSSSTKYLINYNSLNYVKSITLKLVSDDSIVSVLSFGKDYEIIWRGEDKGKIELFIDSSFISSVYKIIVVWGFVRYNNNVNNYDKNGIILSSNVSGSFVYPDMPRNDLSIEKYPRIGFKFTWGRVIAGMSGGTNIAISNDGLIQIKICSPNTYEINYLFSIIDTLLINNFKSFYYIRYIIPKSISSYDNFPDNTEKVFSKIVEYECPDKYQIL